MILVPFQELANESSVPMNYYQVYGQVGKFFMDNSNASVSD